MLTFFFFQAEDGIRDLVRSRGLGDVYKRQDLASIPPGISKVHGARMVTEKALEKGEYKPPKALSLIHI